MKHIRLTSLEERHIPAYTDLYESSFPPSERKELDYMRFGEHAEAYDLLVIETDDTPVAGMVITVTHGNLTMLDYFAVSPHLRGQGIGHAALPLIRDYVREHRGGHLFLEIETPPPLCIPRDPCDNAEQRVRRLAFYRSAGLVETGVRAFIYGNDMELLAYPEDAAAITFAGYEALLTATFPTGMGAERI
jgi:ribosomal protein S18 acetylase RimI-like enzyme